MSKQIYLRTPISYYGGKQKLAKTIVNFIPQHTLYAEPFLGGAAVFFAKEPSEVEVINDTNRELINFYQVCKNRFHELQSLVRVTLHSRDQHDDAFVINQKPHLHDEVRRAWAVWVLSTQSFSAMLDGSWGYDKAERTTTKKISNKREEFTEALAIRLQNAQIECADALYIIQSRDSANSFFYCDPPYYNSNCGHYDGYSFQDFENLLECLSKIKGKFLLSSYPSELLTRYAKQHGWQQWDVEQGVSVNTKSGYQKRKIEVLTANYVLS
jgi:DNA adenine methylase